MRQAAVAGEFEAMDQQSQGSGVRSPGPSRVMEGSCPPAGRAGLRSPWIFLPIRNRQITGRRRPATNRAERILEPGQLQEAFGTKGTGIRIGDPAAAQDAALGKKEDLEPLEKALPQSDPRNGRHTERNVRSGKPAKRIQVPEGSVRKVGPTLSSPDSGRREVPRAQPPASGAARFRHSGCTHHKSRPGFVPGPPQPG